MASIIVAVVILDIVTESWGDRTVAATAKRRKPWWTTAMAWTAGERVRDHRHHGDDDGAGRGGSRVGVGAATILSSELFLVVT